MEIFENFIESEAFFPIVIALLIVLIIIFIVVLLKGDKKKIDTNNVKKDDLIDKNENTVDNNIVNEIMEASLDEIATFTNDEEVKETEIKEEDLPFEIVSKNDSFEDVVLEEVSSEKEAFDAFSITPNDEVEINEEITINEPNEYVSEKTEIFEFPEFGKDEEEILNNDHMDEETLRMANEYIDSIMGVKK